MKYGVQALTLGTPAGRLAFDTVSGDFIRLIRASENFTYDKTRICAGIAEHVDLLHSAQAFLTTFDRYRSFLVSIKTGTRPKLINGLFNCPPAGVMLQPAWNCTFACKRLICPWCRYRQVLQLAKEPWVELNEQVHLYLRVYEADNFTALTRVRAQCQHERHTFLRKIDKPFIRFQRIGLEVHEGRCFYRLVQIIVFKDDLGVVKGWDRQLGTYERAIELSMRYSAANLLIDRDWDLLRGLLSLNRFRRVELSR